MKEASRSTKRLKLGGSELREMFGMATDWLEKNADDINALNVFPVPDGDTGTNMLLTMESVMAEARQVSETNASDIAQAMAKGALMGARGNSGVILSQMLRGFAKGLSGKASFGAGELAEALDQASLAAYAAVSKPREGTMLTVIKDAASTARSVASRNGHDLAGFMEMVVEEARNSVERTPQLLDVLKNAGVVDAGGQGIFIILEGILNYLRNGDAEPEKREKPIFRQPARTATGLFPSNEKAYGYCTEMIIRGNGLRQEQIKRWVESQGESVLVVGDEDTVKIHVHTYHPGTIIEFAISLGTVHDLKIQNMDDQHEDFLQIPNTSQPANNIAVIAVVAGEGLQKTFRSLGATAIIPGGQTMNPSCSDILQAINSVSSGQVIVLPNNKNVIPAARQAAEVAGKTVKVLPTLSIPQGLSALLGFNSGAGLEENLTDMSRRQEQVRAIEITTAVRDAQVNKLQIKKGNYIGLIDGDMRVARDNLNQAVLSSLEAIDANNAGIASLFYGDGVTDDETAELGSAIKMKYPELEVELIKGSQPHYSYIISVER